MLEMVSAYQFGFLSRVQELLAQLMDSFNLSVYHVQLPVHAVKIIHASSIQFNRPFPPIISCK